MKYFLYSFFPFPWFKKGGYQFPVKDWAQVLVNCFEDKTCPGKVLLGKMTSLT